MTGPNDNELVSRILHGNESAYSTIVERHQGRIFYLGLKFFHNPEDAEDFSQEVFLRAYRRLGTFRGTVPFSAWLYRLAYNVAVNRYHVRKQDIHNDTIINAAASLQLQPDEGVIKDETRAMVQQCLQELPDTYHIVLKMHYFDGLSYPEISEITEIPVNTLKSHIRRAKQTLTTLFEKMKDRKHGT